MELIISLLYQHALSLLTMVVVQFTLVTAGHWATKERGWDDTWIGACGLAIVFGGPAVATWLGAGRQGTGGDVPARRGRRGRPPVLRVWWLSSIIRVVLCG